MASQNKYIVSIAVTLCMLLGFGELSANIEDSLRVKSNPDFFNSLPVLSGEDYVSPIFSQDENNEVFIENDPVWSGQKAEVEQKLKEYFGGIGTTDLQQIVNKAQPTEVVNKVYANPAFMPPPPPDPVSASTLGTFLDDEIALIQKARNVIGEIKDAAKWIQRLDGGNLISLPVGLSFGGAEEGEENEGGTSYTLAVNSMKIYPTYTALEIFVEIDGPNMESSLIFYAPSVKFTREGGLSGVISIGLLGNAAINVFDQKAVLVLKRGVPEVEMDGAGNVMNVSFSSGTFINFGCEENPAPGEEGKQKLLGLGLDIEFHFSRDWIKPVPPPLEPGQDPPTEEPTDRVVGTFTGVADDWDDILIDNINLPHFTVTGTEDIEWHVENMVFDFSEKRHSSQFNFPITLNSEYYSEDTLNYQEDYDPEMGNLWKGFYLGQFQVVLPERITGTSEATLTAQDLVIDHNGFTGEARAMATPLIELGETNADGWGFGINRFEFIMVASDLKMIYFDGEINVPLFGGEGNDGETVMSEENSFDYEAFIDIGNVYTFSANPSDGLEINCWKAQAIIFPNSVLNLEYVQEDETTGEENNFKIFTEINAEISVQGDIGENSSINIPPMDVQRMRLRNYSNPTHATSRDYGYTFHEIYNPDPPVAPADGNLKYFEIGAWTFPEEISANIGSFSISFTEMALFDEEENGIPTSGLDFTVSASLDANLAIEAEGDFRITGTLDQSEEQHKWQATDFDISHLHIDASFAGTNSIVGDIHIFKEEDYEGEGVNYGTGFRGLIKADFEGVGAAIDVVAQFGSIEGDGSNPYKYFMVDAMVEFSQGIPLGGIELKGLGGGMYRHMTRSSVDEAFSQLQGGDDTQIGASLSGIQYLPDPDVAFGFKASVILATVDPSAAGGAAVPEGVTGAMDTDVSLSFVATLSFGMEFGATTNNPDGFGIRRIFLQGEGKFMAPINLENVPNFPVEVSAEDLAAMTELNTDGSAGSGVAASEGAFGLGSDGPDEETSGVAGLLETEMSAYVLIDLNFYEDIYDARLKIFASALGDRLKGEVWASLHLNKSGDGASDGSEAGAGDAPLADGDQVSQDGHWFVHVGTPSNRGYLSISASPILDNAELNAYFMMGNFGIPSELPPIELPDFENLDPPLPPTSGNSSLVGSGAGLAFGAGFSLDTGRKNFLMFYGDFAVALGFDFVLTNLFGPCDEDFDVGIDGWYAMGQAYAGLDAEVGAQVKLFGLEKNFSILSAELYTLLRLELPNPIYGYAALDIDIEVLNGLINVAPSFEFDFGTNIADIEIPDCQDPIIWEDVLLELDIIKEIRVAEAEDLTDVSVVSSIEVEFYISDMQLLEFYDEDDDIVQFRTNGTNYITVRDESGAIVSAGTPHTDWTANNRLATRWYNNFLPPNETLTVRSTVYFEQFMGYEEGEEVWEKVYQEGMENSSSELWTELYVHEELEYTFTTGAAPNVIPESNVVSAYPVRDQNYFLKDEYEDGYILKLQAAQNYLLQDDLNTTGYVLQITMRDNEDAQVGEAMEYNFFEVPEEWPNAFDGMYIMIDKNPDLSNGQEYKLEFALIADGTAPEDAAFGPKHIVYELPFSTSLYSTFAEKINALNPIASCDINSTGATSNGNKLRTTYSNSEAFDDFELNGIDGEFAAMVRPEAVVEVDYCAGNEFCAGSQWLCDFEPTFRAIRHYESYECILLNEFFNPYESVHVTQNEFNETIIHYEFADAAYDFVNLVWENMRTCSIEFPCDDYNFPNCPNPGGGNDSGTSSNGPANSIIFDNNNDFRIVTVENGDDCSPAYQGYFDENGDAPTYPTPLSEGTYDVDLKYHLPFSEGSIADFVPTSVSTIQLAKTSSTTDCSEFTSNQ